MDERGHIGCEALPEGRRDFVGAVHPDAEGAKSFGHPVKSNGAQFAGDALPVPLLVSGKGDAPGLVVGQKDNKAEVLTGGRFEFGHGEGQCAVSRDEDDGAVGIEEAGGHGAGEGRNRRPRWRRR